VRFEAAGVSMERIGKGETFKIRISGLSNGLHDYHFSAVPSALMLEDNFTQPVEVDVVVDKTPRQVYLKSEIRASGSFTCDRCLENFERSVDTRCVMFYVFDEMERGKFPEDEVQVISPETVYVDISDDVRQMIVLSIPLKLLCKEECKGLCPHCGKNRNSEPCECRDEQVDPRWQGLAGLMNN
jgi:uncharacterized protein